MHSQACQLCTPNDNFSSALGHVLIIPFRHVADFFSLTFEEKQTVLVLLDGAKELIDSKFSAEGFPARESVMPTSSGTHCDHRRESIGRKPTIGQLMLASSGNSRPPSAVGSAPIDALDQHRELCRSQRQRSARLAFDGQRKTPCSSRLVKRQRPVPSQNTILIRLVLRPRNRNRWPENGSCRSTPCTSMARPSIPFAHVDVAQGQMYLRA